jgi:hypothetical protein
MHTHTHTHTHTYTNHKSYRQADMHTFRTWRIDSIPPPSPLLSLSLSHSSSLSLRTHTGYVQDELAKALKAPGAGVTVVMDAFKVLLAYPINRSVSMRAGDTTYSAPLQEPELPNDATSGSGSLNSRPLLIYIRLFLSDTFASVRLAQQDLQCLRPERTRGGRARLR